MELIIIRELVSSRGESGAYTEENRRKERILGVPTVGDRISQMVTLFIAILYYNKNKS